MIDYQDLDVALSEYKINVFRYDAYLRYELFQKFKRLEQESKIQLLSIDGDSSKKETDKIIADLLKQIKELFEQSLIYISDSFNDFAQSSADNEREIYNSWLGVVLLSTVTVKKAKPIIDGISFDEWWKRTQVNHEWNVRKIAKYRNSGLIDDKVTRDDIEKAWRKLRLDTSNLIRTGNAYVMNEASEELMLHNEELLSYKVHMSTLDSKTTLLCITRDGLRWTIGNMPIGHKVPFALPPLHFNCRSIIRYIIKAIKDIDFTNAKETINYADWLKDKSETYQNKVLGKQRAELFRSGVELNQMLDMNNRRLTLKELNALYR